jgi:PAS domain S-box-containing protein
MPDHTTIFIVEDEAIVANDIKETLKGLGYTVTGIAKAGEIALQKIAELRPSLVLMDIHLAGKMDGIETAGQVKAKFKIPVIFLTAHADEELIKRAKVTEPYGYLLKPFNERELYTAIEMALHKHSLERALRWSEKTNRVLVNATQDILFLLDAGGKILLANRALAKLAGKTASELVRSSAHDLVAQQRISPRMACYQLNPAGEVKIQFEEEFNRLWYDTTIYPIYNEAGIPLNFAVYIRDITDKRKREQQAKENQEFFRALIEDASDIIVILREDGTFSRDSYSLKKTLDYPMPAELQGSFFELIHSDDTLKAKQLFTEILQYPGMIKPFCLKFKRKAGIPRTIKGVMSNLLDDSVIHGIVLNGWAENG